MRPARRVGRNATVLIFGDMAAKIAALGFYAVMARQLGQAGFGAYTFAVALAFVLLTVAAFGLDSLVTREIARDREHMHRVFWEAIAAKLAFGTVAVAVAAIITVAAGYSGSLVATVTILSIATLVDSFGKTASAVFQGVEDMAPIAITGTVSRGSTAIFGIAALLLGASLLTVAVISLLGSLLGLVYIVVAMDTHELRPRFEASTRTARALVVASIPIGLTSIFATVIWRIDATILSFLKGNAAVGLYGAAYRLLDSTLFISFFFVGALFPVLTRLRRDTAPTSARGYELGAKALIVTLLPLGAVCVAFADPIVRTIYGPDFTAAAPALRILGCASVLYGLGYLSMYVLISQDRQRMLPWIVGAVSVQNIVLNLILIPSDSFRGAAIATTVSEATFAALLMYFALRATGPISLTRVSLGPFLGCLGLAATAIVVGESWVGLAIGSVAYCVIVFAAELRLYPDDARLAVTALFGERGLRAGPEDPDGGMARLAEEEAALRLTGLDQ